MSYECQESEGWDNSGEGPTPGTPTTMTPLRPTTGIDLVDGFEKMITIF
jgi:hypothetical protein